MNRLIVKNVIRSKSLSRRFYHHYDEEATATLRGIARREEEYKADIESATKNIDAKVEKLVKNVDDIEKLIQVEHQLAIYRFHVSYCLQTICTVYVLIS